MAVGSFKGACILKWKHLHLQKSTAQRARTFVFEVCGLEPGVVLPLNLMLQPWRVALIKRAFVLCPSTLLIGVTMPVQNIGLTMNSYFF